MTAVQVGTTGKRYSIAGGSRTSVVNPTNGVPYNIAINATDNKVEIWKGNAVAPTSFALQDNANSPAPPVAGDLFKAAAICIDSSNVIRVLVWVNVAADVGGRGLYYTTFNTATDTYSGAITVAQAAFSTIIPCFDNSVAGTITNGNLQVAYSDMNSSRGVDSQHTYYTNFNGTTWSTKFILAQNSSYPDISIDILTGFPMLSMVVWTTPAAPTITIYRGNQVNATSFSLKSALANVNYAAGVYNRPQICQDAVGSVWVAYIRRSAIGVDNLPYIIKHNSADAWGTWQTEVNLDATNAGQYITLSTRGYAKNVNDKNVIMEKAIGIGSSFGLYKYTDYNTFQGNTWSAPKDIEADAAQDPKTFWCNANGGYTANQHSVLQYVFARDMSGSGLLMIFFDYLSLNLPT